MLVSKSKAGSSYSGFLEFDWRELNTPQSTVPPLSLVKQEISSKDPSDLIFNY